MKVLKRLFMIISLFTIGTSYSQSVNKNELLNSIGKVADWNSVNYILFTTTTANSTLKEQSFLFEKNTGRVRFEGKTTNNISLVMLFNYKSKVLEKAFINGKISDNKTSVYFSEVLNDFFDNTKLLFLPMFIISNQNNNVFIASEKIINTEKITELKFSNILNFNRTALKGSIYISKKGEIKEYTIETNTFMVSEVKNIGEGILLPTRFMCENNPSQSIKFNTVAAFTDVEDDRFTNF